MLTVDPGTGSRAIGERLAGEQLIRSKWIFVAYVALTGAANDLKPGRYEFSGIVTLPEIASALVGGGARERVITIREGWDLRDIAAYLEREGALRSADLFAVTGEPTRNYGRARPVEDELNKDFPALGDKPASVGLEGYLYPDTYRIFSDASAEDIVRKMLANFEAKLAPDLRQEIKRQRRTIFEIVTVASLVEKEIPHDEDRPIVAGILWKRLALGMPLQVDASVNYATGKRRTPTADELATDSPFNTYRTPGLPLGPIANPGIGAIRAAVFPEPSPYLFYLSTPEGETVFSRTLEEHGAAKRRYLTPRAG